MAHTGAPAPAVRRVPASLTLLFHQARFCPMAFLLVYGLSSPAEPAWLEAFYPVRRFREAAAHLGVSLRLVLEGGDIPDWRGEGAVLLRGVRDPERRGAWQAAVPNIVQSARAWKLATDKAEYPALCSRLGLPFPASYLPGTSLDSLRAPLVIKPRFGMKGRGIAFLESQEAFGAWRRERGLEGPGALLPESFIAQDYIAESQGRDLRVFIAEGRVLGCIERESTGGASNLAAGGRARPAMAGRELEEAALKLLAEAGLAYGTADFLYGAQGPLFCELNADPGFQGLEEALGLDAAAAILRSVPGWEG